jgi:hypothetical protein
VLNAPLDAAGAGQPGAPASPMPMPPGAAAPLAGARQAGPGQFERLFPEPPGMDAFRVELNRLIDERTQRPTNIEER